jgi:putative membrane protein
MSATVRGRGWRARLVPVLVPVLVVVLAALAGAAVMWTVAGRQTSAPAVPVALVNLDQPVTTGSGKDQKTIAAGRQLAAGLTQPDADQQTPLSWQVVDSDDAAAGLRDGGYYAVLTIPADFSKAITSTSGDKPVAGRLQLVTNDASSTAVGGLARLSVDRAASTLGDQATNGFVDQTLQSITTISTNLDSTSSSAKKLASSSKDLASSSDDLSEGAASLASGADDLADGASQAATASARLASGTSSLDSAAGQLADGARSTAQGAERVSSAAARVARGSTALASQTRVQARNLDRLERLSGRTSAGSRRVADEAGRVAADCRASGADVRFCLRLRALALTTRVESRAVGAVDRGVSAADDRAGRIADGSGSLARNVRRVAGGTDAVASGAAQVSRGAVRLDSAAGQLASGAASLATADEQLAAGTRSTASGAASLASGAAQLDDGAGQLADGADQLSSGLASFATSVPGYSDDQRKALDTVVTTPVTIDAKAEHRATVQAGLVPVAVAATLWLASLMLFLVRDALPTGLAWAQAGAWRRVLTRWLPAVGVGLALTLVLLGVVALAGVTVHAPLGLAGLCVLAVLAFSATNQALVALLGPVGRVVALALAAVQAAAVGGLVPIETAPGLFRTLNGVLPLPRFVDGAGQLVLGGSSGGLGGAVVTLVVWTAAGLLVSLLSAGRQAPLARLLRARGALRKIDGVTASVA